MILELTLFSIFTEDLKKGMECTPKLRDDKIKGALAMWEGMTTDQLNQLNLEELPNFIKFNRERHKVLH